MRATIFTAEGNLRDPPINPIPAIGRTMAERLDKPSKTECGEQDPFDPPKGELKSKEHE